MVQAIDLFEFRREAIRTVSKLLLRMLNTRIFGVTFVTREHDVLNISFEGSLPEKATGTHQQPRSIFVAASIEEPLFNLGFATF